MSSQHSLGYFDLNPRPATPAQKMWRRAGAAVTGLAVVGTVAAAVIIPSIKQSNANLAAYRKSPVIMTCNDPLTRTQVPIRQADLKAIPNIAAQVKRSLVCK